MPRKHLIATKINAKQQTQSKLRQKLSQEIRNAAKVGGNDPQTNPRLRIAITKATKNNLSQNSITKNLQQSPFPQAATYYDYEIFGPEKTKLIITGNNHLRTISNLKGYLNKFGGGLAKVNAVKLYFQHVGIIDFTSVVNEEELLQQVINYPIENFSTTHQQTKLVVLANHFSQIVRHLTTNGYQLKTTKLAYLPIQQITITSQLKEKLTQLITKIKQDKDFVAIYTNVNL